MIYSIFPGRDLAADTTPRTRSALGGTMIRVFAAVRTRKNPFFHSVQTDWCYTDSGPLEPKIITAAFLPAGLLLPMPPPEHVPFWEGPAPEEGTPRVSCEPKGSAHTSPEGRRLRPPDRGAPPTSTRSFVSRRHKSRGDTRSRTGLQCG